MEFIQYDQAGKIVKRRTCEFNQLKHSPLGQKVRVTLNDENAVYRIWGYFFETRC